MRIKSITYEHTITTYSSKISGTILLNEAFIFVFIYKYMPGLQRTRSAVVLIWYRAKRWIELHTYFVRVVTSTEKKQQCHEHKQSSQNHWCLKSHKERRSTLPLYEGNIRTYSNGLSVERWNPRNNFHFTENMFSTFSSSRMKMCPVEIRLSSRVMCHILKTRCLSV